MGVFTGTVNHNCQNGLNCDIICYSPIFPSSFSRTSWAYATSPVVVGLLWLEENSNNPSRQIYYEKKRNDNVNEWDEKCTELTVAAALAFSSLFVVFISHLLNFKENWVQACDVPFGQHRLTCKSCFKMFWVDLGQPAAKQYCYVMVWSNTNENWSKLPPCWVSRVFSDTVFKTT